MRSRSRVSHQGHAIPNRKKTDHLILRTDESLLRDLELPEWGRPVALGAVFVGLLFLFVLRIVLSVLAGLIWFCVVFCAGRGYAQSYYGAIAGV